MNLCVVEEKELTVDDIKDIIEQLNKFDSKRYNTINNTNKSALQQALNGSKIYLKSKNNKHK